MLFGVIVVLYLAAAPALGIWALVIGRRNEKSVAAHAHGLASLRQEIAALRAELGWKSPESPPRPHSPAPETPPAPEESPKEDVAPASEPKVVSFVPETTQRHRTSEDWEAIEESLTSRWLVWLGGLALCLGGAFLVKYSIDQGLLGPEMRTSLGLLLGLLLTGAGEGLRRRPLGRGPAALRTDYVPASLTAAGLFTGFASVYAAYGLYGLISAPVAFVALAAIGVGAVALALLHGPFIALLGLLAGFATPLLVQTETPEVWPLFAFLLVLAGSAATLARLRGWWWLGWAALAGSAFWPFAWYVGTWSGGDALPLGLYLLALAGLFVVPWKLENLAGAARHLEEKKQLLLARGAAVTLAVLSFALVRMDAYGTVSLATLGLLCAGSLLLGRKRQSLDLLPVLGGLLALSAIAAWHLPSVVTKKEVFYSFAGRDLATVPGPVLPPELLPFALTAGLFAVLFGVGGFIALRRARCPDIWAGVSAAMPVSLLAVAYWRIEAFELDLSWAAVALGLAGMMLLAATLVRRDAAKLGGSGALGAYAAATVASISLALTMSLEQAWLTVALSLQLPALAWIYRELKERALLTVAAIIAGSVIIRLVFNPYIGDYDLPAGLFNWLLYGYGLPAAAFFLAARGFREDGDPRLTLLLQAGALIFTVVLVTLEIRHLVVGPLDALRHPILEQALQSIAWLVIAIGLQRIAAKGSQPVAYWGARLLTLLAGFQVLFLQLFEANPLFTGHGVHGPVGLNLLAIAYAAPAVLSVLLAREYRRGGDRMLATASALAGLVLAAAYISLEIRHVFQGTDLSQRRMGDGELYGYSLAWLLYAGVLLGLALKTGSSLLRYASLAVLMGTVAKVFLIDMGSLDGLYRVASFLGLGLSLVGIGYLYQRFVFPAAKPAAPRQAP